jgi:hypothetical protein
MKTLVTLMAVFALTSPLFAGSVDIDILNNADGSGTVRIVAISGDGPVGLALEADAGACNDVNMFVDPNNEAGGCDPGPWYDINIDFAHDSGSSYSLGDGHPCADEGEAGTAGDIPIELIALSLAELSSGTVNEQSLPLDLVTLDLGGAGNIHLDVNEIRGKLVDSNGIEVTANFVGGVGGGCYEITDVPDECMKATHPDYATWVLYGKPDCWCYDAQCKGDVDGMTQFAGAVNIFSDDVDILLPNYATLVTTVPGVCADIDHMTQFAGAVNVFSDDVDILLPNYATLATDCDMTHFNFWIVP